MTTLEIEETVKDSEGAERQINWDHYAAQFDSMCDLLPVYQENIDIFLQCVERIALPPNAKVCDLGAGTGNFLLALLDKYPDIQATHVDSSPIMNSHALQKYDDAGVDGVEVIEDHIQRVDFEEGQFDLIICVNTLFSVRPHRLVLSRIRKWMKEDGHFFVIDFGRPHKMTDWAWYVASTTWKRFGLRKYFEILTKNREMIRQNRQASKNQRSGDVWLHSPEEFEKTLKEAGFDIKHQQTCYRDYCDLALCQINQDHQQKR